MSDVVAKFTLSDENNIDAIFKINAVNPTWGSIDGTLSNQTDLQAALDLKADKTELDADIEEVNSTISNLETVVNNNYTTLDNKIDGVESDLSGDISALSQTVEDNNTAVNNRIDETNDTVSDLSDTVTSNYNTLDGKIDTEISDRTSADTTLQGSIDAEALARQNADTTLQNNINTEASTRQDADTTLQGNIDTLSNTVSSNYNNLSNQINNLADTVSDNYTDLDGKISDLTDTVNDNDTAINNKVDGINTTLMTNINNLSTTVSNNYTTLDTKIDNTKTSLEGDISDLSDTVSQNYTDLSNTITTSASTINSRIDSEVSTLNTAIGTETTNRQNADNNLQSQIDAIVSSSDVFDIVGTYAELQAYDISIVPVNDIIKVLVDSSHENAATYYRCVETEGVKSWVYIGSEGAYYTKSESDTKFVAKTTTINNIPLSSNITLTASDVNALPNTTVIGDGVLTLQKNGVNIDTFNANATANKSINITVPTDTADLTNGAGFITAASLPTVNNGTLTIQANGTTVGTFTANQSGNTTANIVVPDSATWGNITGTLSNQTDLQSALNDKYDASNPDGFISGITSNDIIGALGYTPYSSANPNNYITVSALAGYATEQWVSSQNYVDNSSLSNILTSYVLSSSLANIATTGDYNDLINKPIEVTESTVSGWGFTKNIGTVTSVNNILPDNNGNVSIPISGSPTWGEITGNISDQTDLQDALDAKQNTISDLSTIRSGATLGATALQPNDNITELVNNAGYISGITSSDVTTALGYTPYDASNPAGYTSNVGTVTSVNNVQPIDGNVTLSVPIVDQIYSATSTNAQSGVAINGAKFLQNTATNTESLTIYGDASNRRNTINIGAHSLPTGVNSIMIGAYSQAGEGAFAIGNDAIAGNYSLSLLGSATANYAYQIGRGTNTETNSLYVGWASTDNYKLLGSDGKIPDDRLSTTIARTSAIPTESTVSGWGFTKNIGTVTSVNNITPIDGNVTLSIPDTSNLANKDLSNLSSTGNTKFQAPLVSGTNIKTINNTSLLGSGNITITSAPDIDNKSITTNTDDELQTVGVIDQNNTTNAIKTWTGTKAEYDAIATKDATTLYNIIDDADASMPLLELLFPVGAVYFGTMATCPLQTLGVGTWQALPQDKVIQIAGTRGSVGDTLNESLPNITGSFKFKDNNGTQYSLFIDTTGCVYGSNTTESTISTDNSYSNVNGIHTLQINASRSSSTYQDNAPVQQDAYLLNGWRRIA